MSFLSAITARIIRPIHPIYKQSLPIIPKRRQGSINFHSRRCRNAVWINIHKTHVLQKPMLHTGHRPYSISLNRSQVFHSFVDLLSVILDVGLLCIVAFVQVGWVSVWNASELQDLDQSPGVVLGLEDEHSWFDEFIEVTRLETLMLGWVGCYTLT